MAANSRGQVKDPIRSLTIKEILVAMKGKVTLTREQRFRKDMLIDHIYEATPAEDLEKLIEARAQKQMEKAKSATHRGQKHKRAPSVPAAPLVESMVEADEVDSNSSNVFLELPTDAERKQCYTHFYDATSNTAVEHCICGVCAQECGVLDDSVMVMPLSLMPNSISPRKDQSVSAESKGKLQAHWKHIQYLVIDEVSMISKSFLAKLSRNISIGKMEDGMLPSPHSFGGISVILCRDFFQFPPVACAPSEALYFPTTMVQRNQEDSQTSRTIFEEFTTVVTLKEQMRVTDLVWQDFLQHL